MPNEIYNEGRVVGYSAYELFVKTYLSEGGDPTKVPTEREWLASSIGMGSSMIVKVSGESVLAPGHIDIPLPSNSKLLAANIIIGSFFDGDAVFDGAWAIKVTDYGTCVDNANTTSAYPSGNYDQNYFWQLPFSSYSTEDTNSVSIRTKRLQNYLRITDGVVLMPGQWVHTTGNTPPSDLQPNLNEYPVLRLRVENDGTLENFPTDTEPRIILTGFTISGVVQGLVGVDGSTDTASNIPQDGGFNGPAIFPWASKVILTVPNSYMRKYGISYRAIGGDIEDPFRVSKNSAFIDIDANLNTVYGSTSNPIYTPYTYSTPSRASGVAVVYNYFSTPTKDASTFVVYQKDSNYPPALYANVVGRVVESSYDTEYLYPVDIVAPGTVKVFKNGNTTMMKNYESTFVGTTALNLSASGILSIADQSGLYSLNNVTAGTGAIVTRDASGAWVVSVDATGQIDVVVDSSTKTLTVTPSISQGVKTFTIKDIQTFEGGVGVDVDTIDENTIISARIYSGDGIEVTKDSFTRTVRIYSKIVAGDGISVEKDSNNQYVISNTMPAMDNAQFSTLKSTLYDIEFQPYEKYFIDQNDSSVVYPKMNGSSVGMTRWNSDNNTYGWSTNQDTAVWSTLGSPYIAKPSVRYVSSYSGGIPTSAKISAVGSATTNIPMVPNTYDSSRTYYPGEYIATGYPLILSRCIAQTTGPFDQSAWKECLSYDEDVTYSVGDYCMYDGNVYICNSSTSGEFDPTKWQYPPVKLYNNNRTYYPGDYCTDSSDFQYRRIGATKSVGIPPTNNRYWVKMDPRTDTPSYSWSLYCRNALTDGIVGAPTDLNFRFGHGVSSDEPTFDTIQFGETSRDVKYYNYDRSIAFRIGLYESACKLMFFGSENYQFNSDSKVLIDAPFQGGGIGTNIANWIAYNGTTSSSQKVPSKLSYPVGYAIRCVYPFQVLSGEVKCATLNNINHVNTGGLKTDFGSAVSYNLTRDVSGKPLELVSTGSPDGPYRSYAMIFDVIFSSVADGINGQLQDLIGYEGRPTSPYVIVGHSFNLNVEISPRFLKNNIKP